MTAPAAAPPFGRPATSTSWGLGVALSVTTGAAMALALAFDPARTGQVSVLVAAGGAYSLLAAVAIADMSRRGEVRALFRPASGDLAFGAAVALALYGAAMVAGLALATRGSPREAWLARLYLQIGLPTGAIGDEPDPMRAHLLSSAVFLIAACEEIVWRGLVLRALASPLGPLRALALSSVLAACAHLPSSVALSDATAGPNPLVVLAAFGCSLVWGALVLRSGRLAPALFAHAFFSWAIVEFPIWRPFELLRP